MYIVANKITKDILDISGKYRGPEPDDAAVVASVNTEGDPDTDFSIFRTTDNDIYHKIKLLGDAFELTWSGSLITGVNFDVTSNKIYMSMEFDKDTINADLIDHSNITITMYESDKVTPHTEFNGTMAIPIIGPAVLKADGTRTPETFHIGFDFINGISNYKFFGHEVGCWRCPAYSDGQYIFLEEKIIEVVP